MNTTDNTNGASQAQTFAKVWADMTSMWSEFASKVAGTGFSYSPDASPPEAVRQMRAAVLKGMEEYFADFMRSPQFLNAVKQGTDATVRTRKQINDLLTRAHHELQAPAREDIDDIMVGVRRIETRVLDRLEELDAKVEQLVKKVDKLGRQARKKE